MRTISGKARTKSGSKLGCEGLEREFEFDSGNRQSGNLDRIYLAEMQRNHFFNRESEQYDKLDGLTPIAIFRPKRTSRILIITTTLELSGGDTQGTIPDSTRKTGPSE